MIRYRKKKIEIELEYEKEKVDINKYKGGVKKPRYLNELHIDVFENYVFDDSVDDFLPDGKYNIEIKGSNQALFEFGKYLINISQFDTKDPDYHEHIEDICNMDGEPMFNVKIGKE